MPLHSINLLLQVIYNGSSEIIRWLIVHDGSFLTDEFVITQSESAMFLKSEDGMFNSTTLKNAMICINRYMF